MKEGGFNLRKWRTNNLEFEAEIDIREGQKIMTSDLNLKLNDKTNAEETLEKKIMIR